MLLEVIAKTLDSYSKQRRKEINLHKDDLRANEFETVAYEDSQNEAGSATGSQKPKPKRQDVFIPTDNSLITEILMETQPLEKIEKNLFG